ncbi:MAG: fibronectin type III domain-containing protein, partial [Acidimicrobiales bacterium]
SLYLATAGGGVWSSTDNGASWATHTDGEPDIAMGSVAVDPSDPSVVFAGTGEDNACGDCFYGDGILESTDGGASWALSDPGGMFTGADVSSLAFLPGAPSLGSTTVLAGTDNGLYVSTDGGSTWAAEAGTGFGQGNVSSIAVVAVTKVYVAVQGVGIEETADGGTTWSTLTSSPLPSGAAFGNTAIAVAPSRQTTLYAAVGACGTSGPGCHPSGYVGMFKSTDGGGTWSQLPGVPYYTGDDYAYYGTSGDAGDQSWYDNTLAVDPANAGIVVAGGIALVESTDGGAMWSNLDGGGFSTQATNLIHPDFHALAFDGSGNLYIGCDGGAWELDAAAVASPTPSDLASGYTNLNTNLDITQLYAGTAQAVDGATATVLAGAQDNGTALYSSSNSPPASWPDVLSGDGGFSAIDPSSPNDTVQFAESDSELLGTTDRWKTWSTLLQPCGTGGSPPACFVSSNFTAPMTLVPGSSGPTILFGAEQVYESTQGGAGGTWSRLPTYDAGDIQVDVSALAVAPGDPQVLYAGWDDGTLQMSTDGGSSWTTLAAAGSGPTGGQYVTHIAVSASDPYTAYVSLAQSFPQYASGQAPHVLVGTSLATAPAWTDVTGDLPPSVPTNSVVPYGPGGLVAATDAGVFLASSLAGPATSWSRLGTGLPDVQVLDVLLTPGSTLLATTHGRGVWSIDLGPGAPTGLAATPGNAQVGLAWTAPASDGGSAVTGYDVYRSTKPGVPGSRISTDVPGTTYTDTGLTNGTTYYYEVRAVNAAAEGPASAQVPATPEGPPPGGGGG